MVKEAEFQEYEGWKNYPTWNIALHINNTDSQTQEDYRDLARSGSPSDIKDRVVGEFTKFLNAKYCSNAELGMIKDWISTGVSDVEWGIVLDLLKEKELRREPDKITIAGYKMISQAPWKNIIHGKEYEFEEGDALRDWMYDLMETWVNNGTARVRKETPISEFVAKVYVIYLAVVSWDEITEELRRD